MDRGAHGVSRHWIYQDAEDPSHVLLNLEFQTVDEANAFLKALEPVGEVSGVAEASVLREAEATTY
jgi:hypothetical protein